MLMVVSPQRLCCPWRQILVTRGQEKASREAAPDNTAAAREKPDRRTHEGGQGENTLHTHKQS